MKPIYNIWYLPYNNYLLLDKLNPTNKSIEKTLVLNLNKTLVSYSFSFDNGFEVLRRPGLETFIKELSQYYEIVIYSDEDNSWIEEISSKIGGGKEKIINNLGKEAMRRYKGRHIKDLSYLNRNLSNVVMIDYDINNVIWQPSNTIIIPEFQGDGKDRELLFWIVYLKDLAKPSVSDVRKEIEKYGNYKPYIKYYEGIEKYRKLWPKTNYNL